MKNDGEEAFEELLQLGQFANVESYQRRFQELAASVNDLPEEFRVRCFMKGLRKEIKFGVEKYKPTTMEQAIGLAKLQEMTLEVVARRSYTPENIIGEKIEHSKSTLPVRSIVCESVPTVEATSKKEIDEPKANREQWNSIDKDCQEIRALFSRLLEVCTEMIENNREFRANLDSLEFSNNEMGLEAREITNEDAEDELRQGFEKATMVDPDESVADKECSETVLWTEKPKNHLKLFVVGMRVHDFWVHQGDSKTESNAIHTGVIDFLRKKEAFSSIFWFLLDKIWDPGGHHLQISLNEVSILSKIILEIDIPSFGPSNLSCFLSVLIKLYYHSPSILLCVIFRAIGFLFLSDCWHFQFVFLLSSPFFLESSNVYADLGVLDCTCQVLGEITYPNSATAVRIVTACTKSGGVLCLVLVHNEDPIISKVCLHSVLEHNRRKWPRSILHFSGASDILTIVGYIPSLKDRTVKVHKRGEEQTIVRRRDQDVITVVCVYTIWGLGGIDSKCKIGFMPFVWYCWLLATGMRGKDNRIYI